MRRSESYLSCHWVGHGGDHSRAREKRQVEDSRQRCLAVSVPLICVSTGVSEANKRRFMNPGPFSTYNSQNQLASIDAS